MHRNRFVSAVLALILLGGASAANANFDSSFDRDAAAKFVVENGYTKPPTPTAFDYTSFMNELENGTFDANDNQVRSGEGRRARIYRDSLGYKTIGIGHLVTGDNDPMIARVIEADVRGTHPKWSDTQVKADVNARMAKIMDGSAQLSDSQIDKLARLDVDQRLAELRNDIPTFDQFPSHVQSALLDLKYRGDIRNPSDDRIGKALSKGDFPAAERILAERSRNDQGYNDKNSPGVKTRVDYNRKVLRDYWQEATADALWTRAIEIGQAVVKFPDPDGSVINADIALKRTIEALALLDEENIRRFQAARFISILPFSFTTPVSTGGLTDLFVPANTNFVFRIFDTALEDGDNVTLTIADASRPRGQPLGTVSLTNAGQTFTEFVRAGPVELRILANNEGDFSPNTGGIQVTSPILSGNGNQSYNLNTGQTGTLRVLAQ